MPRCYQAPSAAPSDPAARLEVVTELGPLAQAGTVEDAAQQGDAVVLSIPLKAVKDLPDGLLRGKVVLDTSNYYPFRDGSIDVLVNNTVTTSELMQDQLPGARLVKAFNNIIAAHIPQLARHADAGDRTALPIAADDAQAKAEAAAIIDRLGFDTVDAGSLADSWRSEPDTAVYGRIYFEDPAVPEDQMMDAKAGPTPAAQIQSALDEAERVNIAERRF